MAWFRFALLVGGLAGLVGCGDDSTAAGGGGSDAGGAPSEGGGGGSGVQAVCTEPVAVPCEDEVILGMDLKDAPAAGEITNTAEGDGFLTLIDATAGGLTPTESYTYGRFTDAGLEKVSISDEDALESMDWDISFRRYVGRINSGHSGPSCVTAARLPGEPVFEDVSSVPDGLTRRSDTYFGDSCELIADGTGLPGSPATALSSYWTYPTCVQMTGNVYIVQLADGRQLKLTVTHYYSDAVQTQCQEDESIPMGNSGAGNVQLRWAFLP